MLEPYSPELSLKAQAELLGVSRSSLYYRPLPPSPEEVAIKHRIEEIYTRWPFFGSRRITVVLNREEMAVSRLTVQRYTLAPAVQAQVCVKWAFSASHPVPIQEKRRQNTRFTPMCCVT